MISLKSNRSVQTENASQLLPLPWVSVAGSERTLIRSLRVFRSTGIIKGFFFFLISGNFEQGSLSFFFFFVEFALNSEILKSVIHFLFFENHSTRINEDSFSDSNSLLLHFFFIMFGGTKIHINRVPCPFFFPRYQHC